MPAFGLTIHPDCKGALGSSLFLCLSFGKCFIHLDRKPALQAHDFNHGLSAAIRQHIEKSVCSYVS